MSSMKKQTGQHMMEQHQQFVVVYHTQILKFRKGNNRRILINTKNSFLFIQKQTKKSLVFQILQDLELEIVEFHGSVNQMGNADENELELYSKPQNLNIGIATDIRADGNTFTEKLPTLCKLGAIPSS